MGFQVDLTGVVDLKQALDEQKRAPWRVSAIHEFQLFGLYSLSDETNHYPMDTLVRDWQVAGTLGGLPSALKQAPELVKLVPGGVSGVQFLAFIHFPTKRTLTGWALLFAMGKVTSDDFLYGREHVRVWKCRKTRSKSGTKSGLKRGPSQHPKSRKRPYTGKSSLQRGLKKGPKSSSKILQK